MARVTLAGRMVAGLATTSLTLGLATVVAPSSAAQQAGSDPLSGVYLLDVDLYACTFDDPDDATEFKPPRTCVDPPGAPQTSPDYTNQTLVDLLALAGAVRGELSHGSGLRFPWWRGPFLDVNGVGALPEDGPVRMCFKDQRATWGYFGGTDMFGVISRIGLFRGSVDFGCAPDDLLVEADVTVYAPPSGLRVCGEPVHLEQDDEWVEAQLCLRKTRIDPQPGGTGRPAGWLRSRRSSMRHRRWCRRVSGPTRGTSATRAPRTRGVGWCTATTAREPTRSRWPSPTWPGARGPGPC